MSFKGDPCFFFFFFFLSSQHLIEIIHLVFCVSKGLHRVPRSQTRQIKLWWLDDTFLWRTWERERKRGERERLRDKMMKVFEASRGTSRSNNKGNDIHERVKRRERTRPKIQALRFLLGNYQKVGIKHKCIIMLTINTIMSALLASMFGCGDDVCGGMSRVCGCVSEGREFTFWPAD